MQAQHDELHASYTEVKEQLQKVQEYSEKLGTEMEKLEAMETEENQGYSFQFAPSGCAERHNIVHQIQHSFAWKETIAMEFHFQSFANTTASGGHEWKSEETRSRVSCAL